MNKRLACAAVVSLVLAAAFLRPRHRTLCEGFLPPNDMKIPVGDFRAKGIQEEMFNSVLDRVQAVYGPIVAQHGGELVINRKWDDPTVNANAQRYGSRWIINMYGGLARHPAVTPEGFATVACHELGHHLGGFPKIWGLFGSWASNEGEADYFATLKCLRLVLPDQAPADLDPIQPKDRVLLFELARGQLVRARDRHHPIDTVHDLKDRDVLVGDDAFTDRANNRALFASG